MKGKMTDIVSGFRILKGCLPPYEDPSKHRLFWRKLDDTKVIFFAQSWIENFKIWSPCISTLKVIEGGSRVPVSQFDMGNDNVHQILLWNWDSLEGRQLVIVIDVRDHRSFQRFTDGQLSNFEGETTLTNVEEGCNGK
jgi:hypothetical protein